MERKCNHVSDFDIRLLFGKQMINEDSKGENLICSDKHNIASCCCIK